MGKRNFKRNKSPLLSQIVPIGPQVLLDSSFVISYLDDKDSNHEATKAIFGFITPYRCRFYIPLYVFAEVISKFIQRKRKVSEALKILDGFVSNLSGLLVMGSDPTMGEIIKRYKNLARTKIKFLQSNDFFIVSEGMLSGSIILTCDVDMCGKVKKYHSDIFLVATKANKYKDDIPKFTKRFLYLVTQGQKRQPRQTNISKPKDSSQIVPVETVAR